MSSAILLAGYNNRREVRKYSKIVAEHYGETFVESGYKPLREFTIHRDGDEIRKPLIEFTLERLAASDPIDEIVIVGHQMLLEQRLGRMFSDLGKPCNIVNQNARIPQTAFEHFDMDPKKTKYNSMAGNMIKGYIASRAFENREHALFLASDSPLTPRGFIEGFLQTIDRNHGDSDLVFPAVIIDGEEDRMSRKPLRLRNDSAYPLSGFTDSYGRQGFRLSALTYANLFNFNLNAINVAYNLRKCLSPKIQLKLFRTTRDLGYTNVYYKYYRRRDLSVREVENIASKFINGRFTLIPMTGEEATYDYDGTDEEYRRISEMLNQEQGGIDGTP